MRLAIRPGPNIKTHNVAIVGTFTTIRVNMTNNLRCVTSEYVIVCGQVQSTYPSTYHYVNERRGTHAYVMPCSITFMDFRYKKWKF